MLKRVLLAVVLALALVACDDGRTLGGPSFCVGLEGQVPECPAT